MKDHNGPMNPVFVVARNPDQESSLPYLVIGFSAGVWSVLGAVSAVVRGFSRWPGRRWESLCCTGRRFPSAVDPFLGEPVYSGAVVSYL